MGSLENEDRQCLTTSTIAMSVPGPRTQLRALFLLSVLAVSGDDALGDLLTARARFWIKTLVGRVIG
jgi:hypothetical protein